MNHEELKQQYALDELLHTEGNLGDGGSDGSRSIDGLVSLSISYVRWQYEDELPEMSDEDFNAIFPASRVIGNQSVGVRMYPFVEDKNGERIWLSSLG